MVATTDPPHYTGDTLKSLSVTIPDVDLTGASLELVLACGGTRLVGAGTWTIDDAAAGTAHYDWDSADVAKAGNWLFQVKVTIGGKSIHTVPESFPIVDPL